MGNAGRPGLLKRFVKLPAVLVTLGLSGALTISLAHAAAADPAAPTWSGSIPGCHVTLSVTGVRANATLTGCEGSNYWFSSWAVPSLQGSSGVQWSPDIHQTLYQATNRSPWTVELPTTTCAFQIDFSYRDQPPGTPAGKRALVAAHIGDICGGGQVTTTTSVPRSTTTTFAPHQGATTTTTPATPTTTPRSGGTTTTSTSSPPTTPPTSTGSNPPPGDGPGGSAPPTTLATASVYQPLAAAIGPKGEPGSLAFTGFIVLMLLFAGMTLIGAGLAVLRVNRHGRVAAWRSGGGGPARP